MNTSKSTQYYVIVHFFHITLGIFYHFNLSFIQWVFVFLNSTNIKRDHNIYVLAMASQYLSLLLEAIALLWGYCPLIWLLIVA